VPSLVVVWLENNEISNKGAEALTRVVTSSPSLKYLYLAHNSIGNTGAAKIAMNAFRKLEKCDLSYNGIGQEGAEIIADCLSSETSSIKSLILDSNELGDKGAATLAKGLEHNTTLEVLDARNNHIREAGMKAFRDMLVKGNKTLKHLYLEDVECCGRCQSDEPPSLKRARKYASEKQICTQCRVRNEIEFYLALNRGGRHALGDFDLPSNLWPRMLGRVSDKDPTLLFVLLSGRPDILER
jgi:hypothetical protein